MIPFPTIPTLPMQSSFMLQVLRRRLRRLWSRIHWFAWAHPRPKLVIRRLNRPSPNPKPIKRIPKPKPSPRKKAAPGPPRPIRLASFNAALFSLAPAVPGPETRPEQSPLNPSPFAFDSGVPAPMRSPVCLPAKWLTSGVDFGGSQTVLDVLKEVDADVWALQDVKADEEKDMRPLSDLARALGMDFVFAESWAPEYGNAVLSRWPIKKWRVQKICDDKDFRNVIKATIDVPRTGELNVYCTQLDHLDESWRMKQINAIFEPKDQPHILAGGLNSLDASDYSLQRWNDVVRYYEELGKPSPRDEVTSFLKRRLYTDAKDYKGGCEALAMVAKGQNVPGTCKYGTRVDYILGSWGLTYTFVPGSYSIFSSKGTSDHHIVKVDIVANGGQKSKRRRKKLKQRVMGLTNSCSSRSIYQDLSF